MFEPDKDIIFEDLMGITHDTGDAFLDKKLNQNIAYINPIAAIAGGALLGALSKPKAPKVAGGGIDPFLKPYLEPGLDQLKNLFGAGPTAFPDDMVADFDPLQLDAFDQLVALAGETPDYYQTALGELGDVKSMYESAAAPITAEEIAKQRELLKPMDEAQRLAQKQGLDAALRDIGLGAGGAGTGALTGGRADILRGGAASDYALGLANIEGQLQKTALQQAEADRLRQTTGAGNIAGIIADQLGISKDEFEAKVGNIDLLEKVGAKKKDQDQAEISAEMVKFGQLDPFAFTQNYLGTVFGTPTLPTQIYQPTSTASSILGGITALSGFANKGGAISNLAMGGGATPGYRPPSNKGQELAKRREEKEKEEREKEKEKKEEKKETKEEEDKLKKGLQSLSKLDADEVFPTNQMLGGQQGRSRQLTLQAEARERTRRRLGGYNQGGSINLDEGGNIFERILGGLRRGYDAVKNIEYDPETESLGKYDPFAGFDKTERLRIGLAMMSQMPQLGQSPLSTVAAGAGTALDTIMTEKLTEAETARKARADELDAVTIPEVMKSSAFGDVLELVAQKYDAKVIRDASGKAVGIDTQALDEKAADQVSIDTTRALEKAEEYYQKNPAQFYTLTSRFINENLGPTK